jgi:hypothetical protein
MRSKWESIGGQSFADIELLNTGEIHIDLEKAVPKLKTPRLMLTRISATYTDPYGLLRKVDQALWYK